MVTSLLHRRSVALLTPLWLCALMLVKLPEVSFVPHPCSSSRGTLVLPFITISRTARRLLFKPRVGSDSPASLSLSRSLKMNLSLSLVRSSRPFRPSPAHTRNCGHERGARQGQALMHRSLQCKEADRAYRRLQARVRGSCPPPPGRTPQLHANRMQLPHISNMSFGPRLRMHALACAGWHPSVACSHVSHAGIRPAPLLDPRSPLTLYCTCTE